MNAPPQKTSRAPVRATLKRTLLFGTSFSGTLMVFIIGHWFWVKGSLTPRTILLTLLISYGSGVLWSFLFWLVGVKYNALGVKRTIDQRPPDGS